ncbi:MULTISPECIES: D-alanine--D-alanine ligase [unclassified Gilvimarinus]|uniref:D-alanine--D-alanine ligase n=1 Tax=unclassified Gilvimarinus TaxID=2642066 RepID=UPI0026E3E71D|nr:MULTISPECIES: D-alanine--D-alanine ligase [unclassified Gilvimarinus]MDO6570303.1 D-alanine--D-alanine ligase [Gilvimarinus sp. 2_MG-2023]MDO6746909.1 D-alanine--D-alanine ligase [Gilvimarinus sp. 1_MG-2023]
MSEVNTQKYGRVGVLYGGNSAEREISLKSGAAVQSALEGQGVYCVGIDIGKNSIVELQAAELDRAFIALHGPGGEDGKIQAVLEYLEIPFTGSRVQASAIAMDKLRTKQLWQAMGVSTPDFAVLDDDTDWAAVIERLGGDVMVKPAHEGSSIGMSRVNTASALHRAYQLAAEYDGLVIAEKLIVGAEYTVAILGDRALPPIKLETGHTFYDFEAKYVTGDTQYICPCGLSDEQVETLQSLALNAFQSIGCRGWGRVDVMADANGNFYMLEVNTVPGMTEHSLVPMAGKAKGLNFSELTLAILEETLAG